MVCLISLLSISCVSAEEIDGTNDVLSDDDISFVGDNDNLEESIFLVLENDADKENIKVGEQVTWIISVTNKGAESADNVQVLIQLPEGLEYVSHSAPEETSFDPSTGIWDIGGLSNEDGKVSLSIVTKALTPGEKINKAQLTTDSVNDNEDNSYQEKEINVEDDVENDDVKNETGNNTSSGNDTSSSYSNVIPKAGNPLALILLSMFCIFTTYIAKSKK